MFAVWWSQVETCFESELRPDHYSFIWPAANLIVIKKPSWCSVHWIVSGTTRRIFPLSWPQTCFKSFFVIISCVSALSIFFPPSLISAINLLIQNHAKTKYVALNMYKTVLFCAAACLVSSVGANGKYFCSQISSFPALIKVNWG